MKRIVTLSLLLTIAWGAWSQDCGITINVNPTVNLCAPGSTILLPVITGEYIDFSWSPTTGLSTPNQLITTATVTESTSYTLQVRSPAANNLIVNGDFSQGNTGFESDYVPGTGGQYGLLSNEGQYAVANNANLTHNDFTNCTDHTGGGGMLVVNGSGQINNLWCQDITVQPNTDYLFSAWVTSVIADSPARLQFSVNGINLGMPFNASPSICSWQNFASPWTSANATTARICIVNTNTSLGGNDFALDDITFREVCVTEATVDVLISEVDASIAVPESICKLNTPINPNTYLLPTSNTGGTWTLDGQPIVVFTPASLSNGAHLLSYTATDGNCSDTDDAIFTLVNPPNAGTPDPIVQCLSAGQPVSLNLTATLQGEDNGGRWEYQSGPAGASIDATTGIFGTTTPGDYAYRYIVSTSAFCPADTAVQTIALNPNPTVQLPTMATLDCVVETLTLTGMNVSVGNNIAYTWQRDGQPLEMQFMSSLVVDRAGTYRLRVTDLNTNCNSEAFTTVLDLSGELTVALTADLPTCQNPTGGSVTVAFVTGGTPPYMAAIDGTNFSSATEFNNLGPGDYTITVQDAGGCEGLASVNLAAPMVPVLEVMSSQAGIIPLGQTVTLSLSTQPPIGALDTLFWSPALPDSLRLSEEKWLLRPLATTPYQVTIRDAQGCEATATVLLTVRPEGNVYIPNAISPNEDGNNDRFLVFDQGAITRISNLQIFDRWGAMVYSEQDLSANSPDRAWDGRHNGQLLPQGVYIYSMQVQWLNGESGQLQGEIMLVY